MNHNADAFASPSYISALKVYFNEEKLKEQVKKNSGCCVYVYLLSNSIKSTFVEGKYFVNSFVFIILICQLFMLYFERQQIHKNYSISRNFHQPLSLFYVICV